MKRRGVGERGGKGRKGGGAPAPDAARDRGVLTALIDALDRIRDDMRRLEKRSAPALERLHPAHRESGRNLVHYLALRRHDLSPLQETLAAFGLSSLGRTESHTMASVVAVQRVLEHLAGRTPEGGEPGAVSFAAGHRLLTEHTEALLGPRPGDRRVRVMVTMPSEAAENPQFVRDMVSHGMNCMRVNCAHDSAEAWGRMIDHLRRAKTELGRKCRILMDLGGPKLRTGPVAPDVPVLKWRPQRDPFGRVTAPARIWLRPPSGDMPETEADSTLSFDAAWLAALAPGDVVEFTDARGARRELVVKSADGACRWAECGKTAYVTPETVFSLRTKGRAAGSAAPPRRKCRVSGLASVDNYILLKKGDLLHLTRALRPGRNAEYDKQGRLLRPAFIGCTLPQVFSRVRPGDRIWLDDGRICGVVKGADRTVVKVEISGARPEGERLRGEKGINLPDTELRLSAVTARDREDLRFVARRAHMVGISFAQRVEDVRAVQALLAELGRPELGIVLKIETRRGFEMLPDLLLAAMESPVVGVMIARGDLAVECGYERLAEVQEEILWLCEAAHLPVIWATQVLESLAKTGTPSRAEITDAAMSERAECVMLNKGPHILEAMRVLENILHRMEAHQEKKSPILRQLRWWERPERHLRRSRGTGQPAPSRTRAAVSPQGGKRS